jgi:hypothetical protein
MLAEDRTGLEQHTEQSTPAKLEQFCDVLQHTPAQAQVPLQWESQRTVHTRHQRIADCRRRVKPGKRRTELGDGPRRLHRALAQRGAMIKRKAEDDVSQPTHQRTLIANEVFSPRQLRQSLFLLLC